MKEGAKFLIRMLILVIFVITAERIGAYYLLNDEFPFEPSNAPRYWSHLDNLNPMECTFLSDTITSNKTFYVTRNAPLVFSFLVESQAYNWTHPVTGNLTLVATQEKTIWFTYMPLFDYLGCDSFEITVRTSSSIKTHLVLLHVVFGPTLTQGLLDVPQNFRLAQLSLWETARVFDKLQHPSIKQRLPTQDQFLQRRFRTCAVVGNGGVLKGRSRGKEIDSHEAVFRINASPLEGYEKDVGNKTTFMFSAAMRYLTCWTWKEYPALMKIPHTVYGQIPNDVSFYRDCLNEFEWKYPHIQINLINFEWMVLADEIIREYIGDDRNQTKSKLRSTGMIVFMAASISCDKLKVYGFKESPQGHHHYWDRNHDAAGAWERHTYSSEQLFFHDVATGNFDKVHKYLWPYNLTTDIVFVNN